MTHDPHNPLPGEQPEDPRLSPGQARPGFSAQPATPPERPAPATSSQEIRSASQPTGGRPPRPPRGGINKIVALAGIAGLLAVVGIVTGLAVANNNNSTAAAVHPPPSSPSPHSPAPARTSKSRAPVRRGHLLGTLTGTGTSSSTPFRVTSPAFVHYGYNCASGAHKFTASLQTTSGGNHLPIASTSGTGTSQVKTLHPAATSSQYRISATSACPYFIRVYSSS